MSWRFGPIGDDRVRSSDFESVDIEYARLNARKTIADPRPSSFAVERIGGVTITRDLARRGSYYNRLIGLDATSLRSLDEALEFLPTDASWRVDLDAPSDPAVSAALVARGFERSADLVWLIAHTRDVRMPDVVQRLGSQHHDEIRRHLELEGPIDDEVWKERREYLCTEQFRCFGIRETDRLVSMATTFVGREGVILGNAFTIEAARRRGYQRALLAARLADAARLGRAWVLTDVEAGSTSFRNCERCGFERYRHQEIWERR